MGENAQLLSPQQAQFLSQALGGAGQQGSQAFSQLLQPQGQQDFQGLFEQTYVNPALKQLQGSIIPQIKETFAGGDSRSSSALNQALAEAATDVTTNLGSQFGQFFQNQQQLGQQGQLGALGQLGGLAGIKTFEPTTVTKEGWLGPVLNMIASLAGAGIPKL